MRQFETGQPIFGHAINTPPAIGYFTADRSWEGNAHWFTASGVETMRAHSLIDDETIKLPNQRMKHLRVDFFKECIGRMKLPPGSLLIVDPIALFLGGNLLDYDSVAFACVEIQRWLRRPEQNYCVLGICHTAKQRADKNDRYLRLQDRINGSMAQQGYSSTQMVLAGPDETGDKENRYTFLWNPHTAPAEVFQFVKGPEGLFLTEAASTVTLAGEAAVLGVHPSHLALLATFPAIGEATTTHALIAQYADEGPTGRRRLFKLLKECEKLGLVIQVKHGIWMRTQ